MDSVLPLKISGMGCYLPDRIVRNDELECRMQLRSGWIEKKTGVVERRWVEPGLCASVMAARAARQALEQAQLRPEDVSLIINASGTFQRVIPDNSPLIQRELGLGSSGIPCFSVHSTCLSFLTGIEVAATLLATGRYRHILLVSAEISSPGLDFSDPESASLFGDGAAAAVLSLPEPGEPGALHKFRMESYGNGADLTTINIGTEKYPYTAACQPKDALFKMEGKKVYRLAQKHARGFFRRMIPNFSEVISQIRVVVPHQSTMLGIQSLKRQGIDLAKVAITLPRYGNCVAASIPLTLCQTIADGGLQRGDRFLMLGTGAGLSLAAALLVY